MFRLGDPYKHYKSAFATVTGKGGASQGMVFGLVVW